MPKFFLEHPVTKEVVETRAPTREAAVKGFQKMLKAQKDAQRRAQEIDAFAEQVDMTPEPAFEDIPEPGQPINFPRGGRPARTPEVPEDDRRVLLNNAAASGVDIRTGAPLAIQNAANLLNIKPSARLAAAEALVRNEIESAGVELPADIPAVFFEENTGELAYLRPTEDGKFKKTLFNAPGLDRADVVQGLVEAGQIALEGGAAITAALGAGALTTAAGAPQAAPAAAGVAGAAAAGVTNRKVNELRIQAAKQFGVPDEVANMITDDELLQEALVATGFELAGPMAFAAIKGFRNAGRFLDDPEDAKLIKEEFRELKAASDSLFEQTDIFVAPQAGGSSPRFAIIRANVMRDSANAKSSRLREAEARNNLLMGDVVEAIVRGDARTMPDELVSGAGESARRIVRRPAEQVESQINAKNTELETLLDRSTETWQQRPYVAVRAESEGVLQTIRNQEADAWTTFRESVEFDRPSGVSGVLLSNGPESPINQALQNLSDRAQTALSESIGKARENLARDLGMTDSLSPERLRQPGIDMHELHELSSQLKHKVRLAEASNAPEFPGGEVRKIIRAIDEQLESAPLRNRRGQFLGRERAQTIRDSYMTARQATVTKVNAENRQVVANLLETDGNQWKRTPAAVRQALFVPNNPDGLAEVMRHVQHNPAIATMLGRELDNLYNSVARNADGQWTREGHKRFMEQYKGHADIVLGREQSDLVRNAADMGRRVKELEVRQDKVSRLMREIYGRKLSSDEMFPGNIAEDIFTGTIPGEQAINLTRKLGRRSPETLEAIRQQGREVLMGQLLKGSKNFASPAAVSNLVGSSTSRQAIRALYGQQMVKNMEDAAKLLAAGERLRAGRAARIVANTPAMVAFRSIFGPLSPIQRRLTAGQKLRMGARQRLMFGLVTDPDRVDAFVRLGRTKPGTVAAIQGFTALGIPREDWDPDTRELAERREHAVEGGQFGLPIRLQRQLEERRQEALR